MRRSLLPSLLIAVLASAAVLQAQSKDEQAIRALIDRGVQAGNSVDEKVVKKLFADFGSAAGPFYAPFGNPLASTAEVETFATEFLGQLSARSYAATSPISLRVDKNNAWASYAWHAEATFKDGTRRSLDGRTTMAFVREGKSWKIAHWHSSLPATLPLTRSALDAEAQNVLAVERKAWEALKSKQSAAMADYFAEDASIFVEDQAYRIRGKAEILRSIEAWLRQATLRSYQILDPQVQVVGDMALLTYYFTESGVAAGKEFSTAGKLSVVFVKQDGAWRALHEHRSVNR
jgi:uncharacterized protein (TIGR02246 family)